MVWLDRVLGLGTEGWRFGITYMAWAVGGPAAATTMVTVNSISFRRAVTPEHLHCRFDTAGRMPSWGIGWTGGALISGIVVGRLGLRPTMPAFAWVAVAAAACAWSSPLRRIAAAPRVPVGSAA